MKHVNSNGNTWNMENSFEHIKDELLKIDPVAWAEKYLTIDGKPLRLMGTGRKWMADICRHIISNTMRPDGKPVVMVKGRQVGATVMASALELYMMGSDTFGVAGRPSVRVTHAFPQLEMMYAFSKDKLDKMINNSLPTQDYNDKRNPGKSKPYIQTKKYSVREATDSLYYKQFVNENTLWCESIGSEGTRVLGRTFDVTFFDEVQDMSEVAISKTIKCMAMAQHGARPGGVQVYFGTPRQKGTFFYRIWEESDQRRYYLRCLSCRDFFLLYTPQSDKWKEIWIKDNVVRCPNCKYDQDRIQAIENGKWIATPGKEDAKFVGFHFNHFLIPEYNRDAIESQMPDNNPMNSEITWNTEVIGEFHSGEGLPITFEEIYEKCRDQERPMAKSIVAGEKTTYLGIDWGGKPDIDGVKRGQSYSAGVVISVDNEERFVIEYATKLQNVGFNDKKEFVNWAFRTYGIRTAMGDIGFANDLSEELKKQYGEKYKTVRNASQVNGGVKYNKDELEVVIEKDAIIEEVFNLLRKGAFRFPWASYERIAWLVSHCCSMESRPKQRNGMVVGNTYIKGKEQNDGLMALINAYLAYKFDKTRGFKLSSNKLNNNTSPKALLAYLPRI